MTPQQRLRRATAATSSSSSTSRSRRASFPRRFPRPLVLLFVSLVPLLLVTERRDDNSSSSIFFCAHAGWIDSDTPDEARAVTPLKVVPYVPKPASNKTASKNRTYDDDDYYYRYYYEHHRRHHGDDNETTSRRRTRTPTSDPSMTPSTASPTTTSRGNDDEGQSRRIYDLVFSDEFDVPHRSFADGHDPRWTAIDKNDYTNDAQHYYTPLNAETNDDGHLVITTVAKDTTVVGFDDVNYKKERITKHFTSAMLQSWNKFCFAGGIVEAEISLPGKHDVGGLWPAFWLLGNLARHTYVGSSEHVWPWSSRTCTDKGKTAQLVNACDRAVHYGMEAGLGRGAPEIDIFEVQPGNVKAGTGNFLKMSVGQPFASHSYQVAPGLAKRPGEGWWPAPGVWYDNLRWGENATLNIQFYGSYNHFNDAWDPDTQDYWSDAISFNRQLNSSHFGSFHKYRLEWELPDDDDDDDDGDGDETTKKTRKTKKKNHGYIRWFIDDQFVMEIDGQSLHDSETGGEISSEPMYMILNTAISSQWGFPNTCPSNCPCETYNCHGGEYETCGFSEGFCDMITQTPIEYKINWIRVYQDKNDDRQKVGCSTPERPTRTFIEAHESKYKLEDDVSCFCLFFASI